MKMDIESIALKVANSIPCPCAYDWDEEDVIKFAHALLTEVAKEAEPVAWAYYSEKYSKPMLEFTDHARGYKGEWRKVPLFAAPPIPVETPAIQRYNKAMEGEQENDPIERLRFFLSLALTGRNWLDVERFIDDLQTPIPVSPDGWISVNDRLPEKDTDGPVIWCQVNLDQEGKPLYRIKE
jgi:hypothetical protein